MQQKSYSVVDGSLVESILTVYNDPLVNSYTIGYIQDRVNVLTNELAEITARKQEELDKWTGLLNEAKALGLGG